MCIRYLLLLSVMGLVFPGVLCAATNQRMGSINTATNHKPALVTERAWQNKPGQTLVNINTADASQLAAALKGIGVQRAQAIVAYRAQHGPFKSADDLNKVRGISKKVVDFNRDKIIW